MNRVKNLGKDTRRTNRLVSQELIAAQKKISMLNNEIRDLRKQRDVAVQEEHEARLQIEIMRSLHTAWYLYPDAPRRRIQINVDLHQRLYDETRCAGLDAQYKLALVALRAAIKNAAQNVYDLCPALTIDANWDISDLSSNSVETG